MSTKSGVRVNVPTFSGAIFVSDSKAASAKLTAWSGTYKTKLNTTADLSAHGRHTIKVEIKEKVGGKP
ncbi:hypothetical protein, partial [Prevotella nigrescens]|uniref:hypothetical protein n=1 Tax=Prevotella nigrescens TaxID=28133 RepID=UPI00360C4800